MAGPACPATLYRWVQPALTVPTQKNDPMKPPKTPKTPGRNHDLLTPAVCQSQGPEELKGNTAGGLQFVISEGPAWAWASLSWRQGYRSEHLDQVDAP